MPRYDFRCLNCGMIHEKNVPSDVKEGTCLCGGPQERLFPITRTLVCVWNPPYKPGLDANRDRFEAFKSLEERHKLWKGVTPKSIGLTRNGGVLR
jgi:hypothetical protein